MLVYEQQLDMSKPTSLHRAWRLHDWLQYAELLAARRSLLQMDGVLVVPILRFSDCMASKTTKRVILTAMRKRYSGSVAVSIAAGGLPSCVECMEDSPSLSQNGQG
jgi:hypothetical protein